MKPIIKVEGLSKQYRLGTIGAGTLQHDFKRWIHRIQGKEDPFLKIGDTNDRSTQGSSEYVWALRDINFEVAPGDILGIIGKNGAGKSTLLKILSNITGPTSGRIDYNGRIASLLEVGTGFHPELTGRENIFLNGAILGMSKQEIRSKLDEIIDFSGCERYIDTPVKRYSSGMMVRLGFAVAAHLEPDILVVDEVLAVGDAEFQKKAIGKMKDVSRNDGRSVLFVSHNMKSIKSLCKSGIVLENGSIEHAGDIDSIVDKYIGEQDMRSKIKISDIKDRIGDGIIKFTNIIFLDSKGYAKETFLVGEELNIELYFQVTDAFKLTTNSRIDIGINNQLDERVTWLSTFIFMNTINVEKPVVKFKIPSLMLAEGVYNINLFCETDFGFADWIKNVKTLNMVFKDYYNTGRIIPDKQGYLVTDFRLIDET
ncbi:MAG: lipopolysaccharide transport system ATP-binding protein [Psychroserpens sp.]|jgi:lipopolysaccharide transport system ATP-binding protein